MAAAVPAELGAATQPLLEQIAALTLQIRGLDQAIEKLAGALPGDPPFAQRARGGTGDRGRLRAYSGWGRCGGAQPVGGRISGLASRAEPVGRLRS